MFWTARVPRDTGLSGLAPVLHYVNIEYLNSQTPHNGARLPVKSAFSGSLSSCGLGFLEGGKKGKKVIFSPCGLCARAHRTSLWLHALALMCVSAGKVIKIGRLAGVCARHVLWIWPAVPDISPASPTVLNCL